MKISILSFTSFTRLTSSLSLFCSRISLLSSVSFGWRGMHARFDIPRYLSQQNRFWNFSLLCSVRYIRKYGSSFLSKTVIMLEEGQTKNQTNRRIDLGFQKLSDLRWHLNSHLPKHYSNVLLQALPAQDRERAQDKVELHNLSSHFLLPVLLAQDREKAQRKVKIHNLSWPPGLPNSDLLLVVLDQDKRRARERNKMVVLLAPSVARERRKGSCFSFWYRNMWARAETRCFAGRSKTQISIAIHLCFTLTTISIIVWIQNYSSKHHLLCISSNPIAVLSFS